ncbi:MAG: SEL1-like repeat protein [Alphaproteobacteria bacterium]|nr:SEL1-like repeat protein [Alphaproteobacteria bacterium]
MKITKILITCVIALTATTSGYSSNGRAKKTEDLSQFALAKKMVNNRSLSTDHRAMAQYELAVIYEEGKEVVKDLSLAMKWYKASADLGYAPAQFNLAQMYERGANGKIDKALALQYYEEAAAPRPVGDKYEKGLAEAQFKIGYFYDNPGGVRSDYALAMKWYMRAAEQGLVEAYLAVGQLYGLGCGVAQNPEESFRWNLRAAERGSHEGMNFVGTYCHEKGEYSEALKWFEKASLLGNQSSQYSLGCMYSRGHGVPLDYVMAIKWFKMAAENGHDIARYAIAKLYQEDVIVGGKVVIKKNTYLSLKWHVLAAEKFNFNSMQYLCGIDTWTEEKLYILGGVYLERENFEMYFRVTLLSAEKGSATAMYNVSTSYREGRGVKSDKKLALEWLQKAADKKFPQALYLLAKMYEKGEDVEKDHEKFMTYLRAAAESGEVQAQYQLGLKLYNDTRKTASKFSDFKEAIDWLQKAADADQHDAQCVVAKIYENKNPQKSFEMYLRAAKNGNAEARKALVHRYKNGIGTEKNIKEALKWTVISMEAENKGKSIDIVKKFNSMTPEESFIVAEVYACGDGTQQDLEKAFKLFEKAAKQKHAGAQYSLGIMCEMGHGVQMNKKKAFEYYTLAAQQGYAKAQASLGLCYEMGNGTKRNYDQAVKWYRLASKKGFMGAQLNLANMFKEGRGVQQDYAEAAQLYKAAAEQGNEDAKEMLAGAYLGGFGIEKDIAEGTKLLMALGGDKRKEHLKTFAECAPLLKEESEKGNPKASHQLGLMYVNGLGVEKDPVMGVKLYYRAFKKGHNDSLQEINRLANEDPYARCVLGKMYFYGRRVRINAEGIVENSSGINLKEAAENFRLASEAGNGLAKYFYGYVCLFGYGTEQNEEKAFKLFMEASQSMNTKRKGMNPDAFIGWMYHHGKGVPRDLEKAKEFYTKELDRSEDDAMVRHWLKKLQTQKTRQKTIPDSFESN